MKGIVTLIFLFSLSFSSFSQVLIKARAGLNMSKLQRPAGSFPGEDNQVFKLGPNIGAAVEVPLKKQFSLQAELNYSLKGLKDNSVIRRGSMGDYHGYGYNFHCIELPLLVRMAVCENFRVGLGPSIAWLAKVEESMEGIDVTDPNTTYTKMDYGINGDVS